MTTIKSYTDIEQSKKLAEILPIESADMYYEEVCNLPKIIVGNYMLHNQCMEDKDYKKLSNPLLSPAWSLISLLNAVDFRTINLHYDNTRTDWVVSATIYDSTKYCTKYESTRALNPIDACVEMILKLNAHKML